MVKSLRDSDWIENTMVNFLLMTETFNFLIASTKALGELRQKEHPVSHVSDSGDDTLSGEDSFSVTW